jgi:4-carboxymuconolactone decarboxylase
MSRIPLASIEEQPEPIREWMARHGNLNVFRLLANAPHVFPAWTQMVDELFDSPTFSRRMREVVILRVAHLQGSRYELGQHVGIARAAGLTEQQINAIIDAGDLAAAQAVFGDEALTELLMIISCYYGLALVLNAADLDVDAAAGFQP